MTHLNMPMAHLIEHLPNVRGKLRENVPLAKLTWFRVGGCAEVMFRPADEKDLVEFLKNCPKNIPITVLGATSNLLIRDGGILGVVIRLSNNFAKIEQLENDIIYAGAMALDVMVAKFCEKKSKGGLEFLSGIPGTIGGGLKMNAGAYGKEFKNILVYADAVDRNGRQYRWSPDEMDMQYRHNNIPEDIIFTGAAFKTYDEDKEIILKKMNDIKRKRETSQPIREKTGGSTFANPFIDNPNTNKHAWQLIDEAGCRGLIVGGAQMSTKHCNFMININNATAHDLETLGDTVRKRVFETSGVKLRWEIRRIGVTLN